LSQFLCVLTFVSVLFAIFMCVDFCLSFCYNL
jgi:preprotein translocase subunit SecE